MKISVSNYGPIAEANEIELCPLTVFVGPSNTGKSYLAVLIYALLMSSGIGGRFSPSRIRLSRHKTTFSDSEIKQGKVAWIKKFLEVNTEEIEFSGLPEELQNLMKKEIPRISNRRFHQELNRCLGTSQKDHLTSKAFRLGSEDDQKILTLKSSDATPSLSVKKNLKFPKQEFQRFYRYLVSSEFPEEIQLELFLDFLANRIFPFYEKGTEPFYLPAARTGLMQSHRAIAGALVRRATGGEPVSVPALSGIVSDFLEEIILMDTSEVRDQKAGEVADYMEESILHGSIQSESAEGNQYPSFLYKQNGLEIPLLRSSSMVSELAPIILFIRHRVGKGDWLIIEEPEAHLHPEAQRKIAETVVRLVRAGVRVMVTTHSDYFLDQLANHIRLSKLKRKKISSDRKSVFLKESEIGAYRFVPQEGGTVVERLHFDQEDGLSPEDHDKVSSDLYNETVEILEQLDN